MQQLLVSDLTAPSFTNGVLAAGAVCAVGKDASGANIILGTLGTQLYSDSQEIRFVQGTPEGRNIFSPWINGKDIFSWYGQGYAAQVAQSSRLTFTNNLTVAGEVTVKFTEVNNGIEQFKRKTYVIQHLANAAPTDICIALTAAVNADIVAGNVPWIASITDNLNGTVDVVGSVFSLTARTHLASFRTQDEGLDSSNGMILAVTSNTVPSKGSGVADVLADYERSLQGNRAYYQRVELPTPPASYIDVATPATYDLYSIQFHNPEVNQIHGVDNRRVITIAMEDGAGANQVQNDFELALNTYLASVPGSFSAVNI